MSMLDINQIDNDSGLVKNRLDFFALDKLGDALNQSALTKYWQRLIIFLFSPTQGESPASNTLNFGELLPQTQPIPKL